MLPNTAGICLRAFCHKAYFILAIKTYIEELGRVGYMIKKIPISLESNNEKNTRKNRLPTGALNVNFFQDREQSSIKILFYSHQLLFLFRYPYRNSAIKNIVKMLRI